MILDASYKGKEIFTDIDYKIFGIFKLDQETLVLKKGSYIKEEGQNSQDKKNKLKLIDLKNKGRL